MQPYFEAEDKVWDELKAKGRVQDDSLSDYSLRKAQELLSRGVAPDAVTYMLQRDPIIKSVMNATSTIKTRMRARNKELDAALIKWGYASTPIRFQESEVFATGSQGSTSGGIYRWKR